MKELKMFPQITEETEENLLNLEDDDPPSKPPYTPKTPPPDSPTDLLASSSPNDESQGPCPSLTVTNEDVEVPESCSEVASSPVPEEDSTTAPTRVRMRSLSGGAYRLTPAIQATGRMRRVSGDDVLTRVSPSRRANHLIEHFRPRSKSDSKGKRPTFLSNLRNTFFSGSAQRKTSLEEPLEPLQPEDYRQRSRSGSETRGGTMSKMIDLFRNRSNSLSIDSRHRKPLTSVVPTNALLRRHSVDPDKRRKPYSSYRSLDAHQGEAYVCHAEEEAIERIDYAALAEERIIPTFLGTRQCYDLMPVSGKVVIISVDLLVKNAFNALVTNDIRSVPLWDASILEFIGMLTITDFINVLRHYFRTNQDDIKDIEDQSIATWRRITDMPKRCVKINGMDSLAQATKLLIQEGVHRLPVMDEKRHGVLFIITRKRLLSYLSASLFANFDKTNVKTPSFFKKSVAELQIGTYENIATVDSDMTLIEALDLFVERKVSALPVLNKEGCLEDVFEKLDVFALAKEQAYQDLNMTLNVALSKVSHVVNRGLPIVCRSDDSLESVINKLVAEKHNPGLAFQFHRVVVVDEENHVVGMISLSDILKFLVIQPLVVMESSVACASETIQETAEGAVGGPESTVDSDLSESVAALKVDDSEKPLSPEDAPAPPDEGHPPEEASASE